MQEIDIYSFLYGMASAAYFVVCLVCGLQLCFNIFNIKEPNGISRLAGYVMLGWSLTCLLYTFYTLIPSLLWMCMVGYTIDTLLFAALAWGAYTLYANRLPQKRIAFILAFPYIIYTILLFCLPYSILKWLPDVIMATLVIQYLYFARALRRHERELDDLYSNQDAHSLRWLLTVVALLIVWWILHDIFQIESLNPWYDFSFYTYMVGFVFFIFTKICKYNEPVSVETQMAIEQIDKNMVGNTDDFMPLQKTLIQLMEDKQIYLNPNLTVENLVKELDTNTKSLHALLHNGMHTNFAQFINMYRVEHAKKLLETTDYKVVEVAKLCGFNSAQVFHRVFVKMTGKTPIEWRMQFR